MDWLFRKCVRFPTDFDPVNLIAGDRIFLLYYLRGITHGNEYEFIVTCTDSDCGAKSTHEYDLNDLASTVSGPNDDIGSEPFKVVLPYMSEITNMDFWVKVRLLRGYDMLAMIDKKKMGKRAVGPSAYRKNIETVDETLEENINMTIVEAMGDDDPLKIQKLVNRLHARDTATIREFLNDNSPGMDTTIQVVCPECDNTMMMELPITESFFRPKKQRKPGT